MYTFAISEHLEIFLLSLGMGFLLGVLYDAIRIIRLIVSKGKAALFVFDFLTLALSAVLTYLFILAVNKGAVRAYIIIAELLGFFCYYISFGIVIVRLSDKIVSAVKSFAAKIFNSLKKPFFCFAHAIRRLFYKIKGFLMKKSQKSKNNFKKLLHINKVLLYNFIGIFSSSKKPRKRTAKMKTKSNKSKKGQKHPVGIIITVMTLAVFIYLFATFLGLRLDIKEKKEQVNNLSAQYEQQLADNEELQKLIDEGDEAQYIEHIAREKRGYVYPDERVYYDITPGAY